VQLYLHSTYVRSSGKKACVHVVLCSAAKKMYAGTVASMHGVMFADNTVGSQDRQHSCSIIGRLVYFRSFGLLAMSCWGHAGV
jgi:hypothetical protein